MRVDIVIPVYGNAHLLQHALESLHHQGVSVDVIVVDDGNVPAVEVLDGNVEETVMSIRVTRLAVNGGISRARNTGLTQCGGDAVIFLDADDELQPGALRELVSALEAHDADAAFGFVEEFGTDISPDRAARAAAKPAMLAGSTLMRRSSLAALGPFDESLRVGEFIDLMARAKRQEWNVVPVHTPVLRRRIHDRNASWTGGSADFLRVVRRHLHDMSD